MPLGRTRVAEIGGAGGFGRFQSFHGLSVCSLRTRSEQLGRGMAGAGLTGLSSTRGRLAEGGAGLSSSLSTSIGRGPVAPRVAARWRASSEKQAGTGRSMAVDRGADVGDGTGEEGIAAAASAALGASVASALVSTSPGWPSSLGGGGGSP